MRGLVMLVITCSGTPQRSAPPQAGPSDRDADRIADNDDMCPTAPEDRDAFEDADGCPDPDNDKDRILDVDDKCPNDMETYNARDDDDGCPDRGCKIVRESPMCIQERIYFTRGKAMPAELYEPILDNAALAMTMTTPDIELVELRGFRSGDEPAALSKQRASAVHGLLVKRGVDAARLVIVDGGVAVPSDAPNGQRRVHLEIVKQRVSYEDAEAITCTPMGRYFRRLTDAEREAACN